MPESWTGHPQTWWSRELATPKNNKSPELYFVRGYEVLDSAIFWGWQVLESTIFWAGQFRTLLFSGFWHIGKLGGGNKDGTPFIRRKYHFLWKRYLNLELLGNSLGDSRDCSCSLSLCFRIFSGKFAMTASGLGSAGTMSPQQLGMGRHCLSEITI